MTAPPTPDRELFQKFLADLYEVRQSGVANESLAATLRLHRLISSGDVCADDAISLIAESAQGIANADGVIIGTLRGNQLIYRASVGSAAAYVGQRGMACISPNAAAVDGEILRVENSGTDTRIESAVCRQFGAQALLIVPVYHAHRLAGVLGILFESPHSFEPAEVRSYRLMAGLVDEAVSQVARPMPEKTQAAEIERECEMLEAPATETVEDEEIVMFPAPEVPASFMTERIPDDVLAKIAATAQVQPAQVVQFKKRLPIFDLAHRMPALRVEWKSVAAIAALAVVGWIAIVDRHVTASQRPTTPPAAANQQIPVADPKHDAVSISAKTMTPGLRPTDVSPVQTVPPNLQVGDNGFDYEDAAPNARVRLSSLQQRIPAGMTTRVLRKSEDVTVRYFSPPAKPVSASANEKSDQVRYLSDDVTVHYFRKSSTTPQGPE